MPAGIGIGVERSAQRILCQQRRQLWDVAQIGERDLEGDVGQRVDREGGADPDMRDDDERKEDRGSTNGAAKTGALDEDRN